jgi:hypothetical protein
MVAAATPWSGPSSASGPYFFYGSEGCDGHGFTFDFSRGVASETETHVSGWTYLSGNYQGTDGQWYYGLGPGWEQYYRADQAFSDAPAANYVRHTACNPGGSCPYTTSAYTSYPP